MKLSIITINYNNKIGLEKTIESVISQTWRDFEWIIIDGGSTDGSKELIENLNSNPNANIVYWCSEPDKGVYNAMNKGIAKTKGEYLNFMNSGDRFYANTTLAVISMHLTCYDFVIGRSVELKNGRKHFMCDAKGQPYDYIYFNSYSLPHQATFYKRDVFERFGTFDENLKCFSDWKHAVESIYLGRASSKYLPVDVCLSETPGISSLSNSWEERTIVKNEFFPVYLQQILYNLTEDQRELNRVKRFLVTRIVFLAIRKLATLIYKIKGIEI